MSDPTAAGPFRLGYRPELDGLRALAVTLVFCAHIGYPWPSLNGRFMSGAFQGVDLFFVLSGFLLTKLLLEERATTGGFSFSGFYRRRALRLLPALFFMLIVLSVWTTLRGENVHQVLVAEGFVAIYVTNWATIFGHPGIIPFNLSHMWSLAVEEQYYLLFFPAFIGLLGLFKKLTHLAWFLVALIGVVWVDRFVSALHTSAGTFQTTLYIRTDTRADALLIGPLLAVWLQMGHRITPRIRLLGIPAAIFLMWTILYARVEDRWVYQWALAPIEIAWALVLMSVLDASNAFARGLRARPVVWIGRISYGLYLWHLPIFVEMRVRTADARLWSWAPFVLALAITFAIATFSFYVVERPFLRRKRPRGSVGGSIVPDRASEVVASDPNVAGST